jgi:hypothetical protein
LLDFEGEGMGITRAQRAAWGTVASTMLGAISAFGGSVPPNDSCETPLVLPDAGPFPIEGTINHVELATVDPNEPFQCFNETTPAEHSVWFHWTAPTSGRVVFDTCGSNFNTFVGIRMAGRCGLHDCLTFDGANDLAPCADATSSTLLCSTGSVLLFEVSGEGASTPLVLHYRLGFEPNCQIGNANIGTGSPVDVLFATGGAGEKYGVIEVSPTDPFQLRLEPPPIRYDLGSRYVIHAWSVEPRVTDSTPVPRGLGSTCLPIFWTGLSPQPIRTANTIGHASTLGADNWPGPPLPRAYVTLLNLPAGIGHPGLRVYFQGLIEDDGVGPYPVSFRVTNGIVLRVLP